MMFNRRTAWVSAATLLLGAGLLGAGALPASGDPAASSGQQVVDRSRIGVQSLAEAERLLGARTGAVGETLVLYAVNTSFVEIDLGDAGLSTGDLAFFEDDMYSDPALTRLVGFQATRQQYSGPESNMLEATLDLPGGSITVAGAFTPPLYTPIMAITGGTGRYTGAGGLYTFGELPDGTFFNVLRVTR